MAKPNSSRQIFPLLLHEPSHYDQPHHYQTPAAAASMVSNEARALCHLSPYQPAPRRPYLTRSFLAFQLAALAMPELGNSAPTPTLAMS